jgi:homeobox protein YOX1/YHP1
VLDKPALVHAFRLYLIIICLASPLTSQLLDDSTACGFYSSARGPGIYPVNFIQLCNFLSLYFSFAPHFHLLNMSNSRDDHYYASQASLGKAGKSSSLGDPASALFQTGQGGRTVLPPISSAFPTSHFPASGPYNQFTPRSMQRYEYNNNPALYNQWPGNNQQMNYSYYDPAASQAYYPNYTSARASPAAPEHTVEGSRKLPPLATGRDDRWSSGTPSYSVGPANFPSNSGIRSPTASYPHSFAPYPSTNSTPNYGYSMSTVDAPNQSHLHTTHNPSMMMLDTHRSASPSYTSGGPQLPSSYTPPPVSPTTGTVNEPTIKKKRKRADAAQLKVLNDTYTRTAFPSTEERQALAKQLDMSARSVQIWFQNKRQSMRQTRQSSSSLHSSFGGMTSSDNLADDHGHSTSSYDVSAMQMPSSYVPRSSQESHPSPTASPTVSHRRPRSQDAVAADPMKSQWPRY